jgi:hypothetical protein
MDTIMGRVIGKIGGMIMVTTIQDQEDPSVSILLQQKLGYQVTIFLIVMYGVQVIMRHVITLNIVLVVGYDLFKSVYYFDF